MHDRQASGETRPGLRPTCACSGVRALVLLTCLCCLALVPASRAGSQPHVVYLPAVERAHFSPGPAPVLLLPANQAQLQTLIPQLEYDAGSDALAVASEIQIAVDAGFEGIVLDGLVNAPMGRVSCTVWFNLEPSTTYYWRAWLDYPGGGGPYSQVRSFVTGSGGVIPQSPDPVDPPNGSRVWPGQATLEWSAVPAAQSYEVSWGRQSLQYFEHSLLVGSNSTRVAATQPGTLYQWRVRARSAYAWSDWSQTWTFTTANVGSWVRAQEAQD